MHLIIVLLVDRFGQSNKFGKKSKMQFKKPNRQPHIMRKTFSQGSPVGDVLRTFSRGRSWDVRLGRPKDVSSTRLLDVRSGRPREVQL